MYIYLFVLKIYNNNIMTTYSGFSSNFTNSTNSNSNIDLFSNAITETYSDSSTSGWYSSQCNYTTYTFFIGCLGFIVNNVDFSTPPPYSNGTPSSKIQYHGTSSGPFGTHGALSSIYSIILTSTNSDGNNAPNCISDIVSNSFSFILTSNSGDVNFIIVGLKHGCNNPTSSLFGSGYTTNFISTNETNDILSTVSSSNQFTNNDSDIFNAYTCSIGNVSMVISEYDYTNGKSDNKNTISWTQGDYWNWTLTSSTGTSTINNSPPTIINITSSTNTPFQVLNI